MPTPLSLGKKPNKQSKGCQVVGVPAAPPPPTCVEAWEDDDEEVADIDVCCTFKDELHFEGLL